MINSFIENISNVCRILNKHSVDYIVIGGAAVLLHGYFRRSIDLSGMIAEKDDLDIWYNPTYDNYFKVLNALEELGQDVSKFRDEQAPNPKKSFFKYDFDSFTFDLLPELKSLLKFSISFKNRKIENVNSVTVSFISIEDLVLDKEFSARPKDKNDIEQLERMRKSND